MSAIEWYYARDNKQMGPVSAAELKRLASVGSLVPDDLVWREGMTAWAPARNVRGLFDEEGPTAAAPAVDRPVAKTDEPPAKVAETAAKPRETPPRVASRHLFDALLDKYRPHFNAHFIETTAGLFRACGTYGLLVAAALAAVFSVILATKLDAVECLLYGAVAILLALALHYVAGKCCSALDEIDRNVAGRLSSALLPNCLAVLSKLLAVAALLLSVAVAVETAQYAMILFGVAGFLVLAYLAVVALNPAALNVSIAPEPLEGEEAIGAIMFLLKAIVRLAPVAFGVGVICGSILAGIACYQAIADDLFESGVMAWFAGHTLLSSAILPLVVYLAFLLGHLLLSLWRSILSLPPKLDKLAEKGEEKVTKPSENVPS
jgi:hypothetical protein